MSWEDTKRRKLGVLKNVGGSVGDHVDDDDEEDMDE
jgi:hypothetical protein